ncbi:MAG: hypothetical protein A2075_07655 [Geobacteraceae bacterium GWC2_58_44]|nr:MAG: hypothetical protein A2075_07655 [Geobacteraceae bacterium GWC2_58_44]
MRRRRLVTFLLLVLCAAAAHAAPAGPRPYSGCGVVALKGDPGAGAPLLVLYHEPGLLRVAELAGPSLPRLAGSDAEPLLAVSARKGGWTRLAYDDAGREGWIEQPRAWEYLPWREFLPGRLVRILPGMKKGFYVLRSGPAEGAPASGVLTRDQTVRVLQVEEEWARLQSPAGWFRWRDGDGRLTLSLQDPE